MEQKLSGGFSMTSRLGALLMVMCLFLTSPLLKAQGQGSEHAAVIVPDSSVEHAGDRGVRAHTNHLIRAPQSPQKGGSSPAATAPAGLTPQYAWPAYGLTWPPTTGSGNGVIAIVDAYDYPTAKNDFDVFSNQFGLPHSTDTVCNGTQPCFQKVLAFSGKARTNCGWNQEAALDIEWAHAMAPHAQIVLVIAKSNSFTDLFHAVDVASGIVGASTNTLGGEVSMSWGGSEFSSEASNDGHFTTPKVVYFASSGDTGGKNIYPSVSPNVVSAGGTTLTLGSNGSFVSETAWSSGGGGPSAYELIPPYQSVISGIVGSKRGAPDFSFDANPNTGVSVYDSTACQGLVGWMVFGGTSVAAPSLAGIVNVSNHFYSNSGIELSTIYSSYGGSSYSTDFRDITSGSAGSFSTKTGWDFVTGVGSNKGTSGK
jgi:subtilase family serine protease